MAAGSNQKAAKSARKCEKEREERESEARSSHVSCNFSLARWNQRVPANCRDKPAIFTFPLYSPDLLEVGISVPSQNATSSLLFQDWGRTILCILNAAHRNWPWRTKR